MRGESDRAGSGCGREAAVDIRECRGSSGPWMLRWSVLPRLSTGHQPTPDPGLRAKSSCRPTSPPARAYQSASIGNRPCPGRRRHVCGSLGPSKAYEVVNSGCLPSTSTMPPSTDCSDLSTAPSNPKLQQPTSYSQRRPLPQAASTTVFLLRNASLNLSANAAVPLQSLSVRFCIASGSHSLIIEILCSFWPRVSSLPRTGWAVGAGGLPMDGCSASPAPPVLRRSESSPSAARNQPLPGGRSTPRPSS